MNTTTSVRALFRALLVASLIAREKDLSGDALHALLHSHARKAWIDRRFYRMLSRMLFRAAHPPQRWKLLDHFYRKDRGLIRRFYAARSTLTDKIRLMSGKPPVPISRAAGIFFNGKRQ